MYKTKRTPKARDARKEGYGVGCSAGLKKAISFLRESGANDAAKALKTEEDKLLEHLAGKGVKKTVEDQKIMIFEEHGGFAVHVNNLRFKFDDDEADRTLLVKLFKELGLSAEYEECF